MNVGAHIGEHVLEEQIAVGGFGTVWKARHRETGEVAAIKILHNYLLSQEILVKRFEREARAIALMHHPNIVELHNAGRLMDGRPYLVMELLRGVDLGAHITRCGTLPPREIAEILEQLGEALAAAHAQGIVHRDLKASNVFLEQRDETRRVVLFDFGIAKLLGDNAANLTKSSSLVGSPACMSPEQILGREVDPRTDIYALGSLTYQMLVGHPPFSGASPTAILTMHLDDYPPYPSLHGDVSPAFDRVIMKAMAKEPDDRFQDVAGFVQAFRAALDQAVTGVSSPQLIPPANLSSVPAVALYIDVAARPEALEEPEDALLDDMESIVPQAGEYLEDRGYRVAYERGTSALFVRLYSAESLREVATRREEVLAAVRLYQELESRSGGDPAVQVRIYLHVGEVLIEGDEIESLVPLDVTDWTPAVSRSGVFAADSVLAGWDPGADEQLDSSVLERLLQRSSERTQRIAYKPPDTSDP